jgi:hypothetical protein
MGVHQKKSGKLIIYVHLDQNMLPNVEWDPQMCIQNYP